MTALRLVLDVVYLLLLLLLLILDATRRGAKPGRRGSGREHAEEATCWLHFQIDSSHEFISKRAPCRNT